MQKCHCLLLVLKRSYIYCYITCMTVPLTSQETKDTGEDRRTHENVIGNRGFWKLLRCRKWLAGAWLGGGWWEGRLERTKISPAVFRKSTEVSWFYKKGPDCAHPWVKFSIQNVVLRISRRKNSKLFPCGAFFSWNFDEIFIEVSQFHETFPALKQFWLHACLEYQTLFDLSNSKVQLEPHVAIHRE